MIGLVIASHGQVGDALLAAAQNIVGKMERVVVCSVDSSCDSTDFRAKLLASISIVDRGSGAVVMTDMLGGTPCIQGMMLETQHAFEIVTGVNVPLIIKADSMRKQFLHCSELAQKLVAAGQQSICCTSNRKLTPTTVPAV